MNEPASLPIEKRVHLEYLDGLRGCAALCVLFFHIERACRVGFEARGPIVGVFSLLEYGGSAVTVFIALSGYCLMIPVARRVDAQLAGGTFAYLKRRARRILPAYYAATFASIAAIACVPALQLRFGTLWDDALPIDAASIVSHLFLVQNMRHEWNNRINITLWTVATECQIYLIFPLLLIAWRRAGILWSFALSWSIFVVIWVASRLIGHGYIREMCPWYVVVFSMGMIAAFVGFIAPSHPAAKQCERIEARTKSWLCFGLIMLVLDFLATSVIPRRTPADLSLGAATACFLIICTRSIKKSNRSNVAVRLLESLPVIFIGNMSYSLYLMHGPVCALIDNTMRAKHFSALDRVAILFTAGPVASILFAYVFYRIFERPFVRGKMSTVRDEARAEVLAPAP